MQLGMIGLGRMGANIVRRLMRAGHECVVYDVNASAIEGLAQEGAMPAHSLAELAAKLRPPRAVWVMVPAAFAGSTITDVAPHLEADDIVIDGGNSYYLDDIERSKTLASRGIHYLDVGTSGGVFGLERGYCLMIGGDDRAVDRLDPIFAALAPGEVSAAPTPGRSEGTHRATSTAAQGYLHCGPAGAGHFVKMVHNGIEYGLMAAYAEGFGILRHANVGAATHEKDAETAPLRNPEHYQYELDLPEIAELWRRGSVVSSWLLDLTAQAFVRDPHLAGFSGRVSDSGEGRWTIQAAVESGAPAPVLSAALFDRFTSRGEGDFAHQVLSAMRKEFGGHAEKPTS